MIENAILAGLAGWRLASLLVQEDGPFSMFEIVRRWAGVPKIGLQAPRPFVGGLLSCVWCCSVWTCGAAYALGYYVSWTPVAVLAAMSTAIAVQRYVRG